MICHGWVQRGKSGIISTDHQVIICPDMCIRRKDELVFVIRIFHDPTGEVSCRITSVINLDPVTGIKITG